MTLRICSFFMAIFTLVFLVVFSLASTLAQAPETVAKQAIIIDYDSGAVLFEKNADQRMPTSSMSKVMSIYVVFDALQKGHLSLDDTLVVSEKAWRKGGSKMFVPVGKTVTVEDLVRGVIIQSGNDAAIVLAEGLSGSEDAFAQALTKKAHALGMSNSQFKNASGWPDPDHYSTARDLATLARAMITEFPEYYGYYAEKSFSFNNIKQDNRNPLLYRDIGADGLKTGHTDDGGYGLMGSAVGRDGRRVVMVLNGMKSKKERASESVRLMQWALNGFQRITFFEGADKVFNVDVVLGAQTQVGAMPQNMPSFLVPKLLSDDIKVMAEYKTPLVAPIKKGQEIGVLNINVPSQEPVAVPLVAIENVAEMNFFLRMIAKARMLTTGEASL